MTEKLQQKAKEEIAKLPKLNQDAINAIDWIKITEEIGKKFSLGENEMNDFQTETLIILVGLVSFDLYISNVENIGMTHVEAESMTKEVFEKILTPIAEKMEVAVRSGLKSRDPKWDQRINFILSDGDYSNFI